MIHYEAGYNYRNWGVHGSSMDLLVEEFAEGEVGDIEAKLEQRDNVIGEVRSVREGSLRHWQATWAARFVGALVKRKTTSKKTKISLSSLVCEDTNLAKSGTLQTLWAVLPTSRARILVRCLES